MDLIEISVRDGHIGLGMSSESPTLLRELPDIYRYEEMEHFLQKMSPDGLGITIMFPRSFITLRMTADGEVSILASRPPT